MAVDELAASLLYQVMALAEEVAGRMHDGLERLERTLFEADLLPQQFGFRPGRDAKTAVRRAFWHITDHGRSEVVDADLSDYFASIPHGPLMRCVGRRVADGTILAVIKAWLTVPVVERVRRTIRYVEDNPAKARMPRQEWSFVKPYDGWPLHKRRRQERGRTVT